MKNWRHLESLLLLGRCKKIVFFGINIEGEAMTFTECINKFRSIKIIHDIIHRIDYSYIAEFFRFIGILVCEEILVEPGKEKSRNTDIEKK